MTPPPSPEALIQRLRDLAGCARYGGGEWPCRDRKYPLENWCPGCTSAGAADALASSQEALRAAERARDEKEERIAGLRMDNARLIERIRIISHAETEAFDRAGAAESALQAKEQEIARLRAALVVPATYWREYFEAGDGSHSTHDEFWLQWLNEHSEQIQAVLASSGAETP